MSKHTKSVLDHAIRRYIIKSDIKKYVVKLFFIGCKPKQIAYELGYTVDGIRKILKKELFIRGLKTGIVGARRMYKQVL